MLNKSLKFAMVFAVVLGFFGNTAMAGDRVRDSRHPGQWERSRDQHAQKWGHSFRNHRQSRHHEYAYREPYRHSHSQTFYHQPQHQVSKPHPLAPRIVFLGPIPVPVPPPPHEVIGYLTGHH